MNGSGTAIPHQMPGVTGLGALQPADLCGRVAITGGSSDTSGDRLCFDRFTLLPVERLLLADDKPVHIGGRALDILIALTANAGTLMTKDDLLARVWPGMCVEDGNLRVHIVALRKALGDSDGRLIRTVAGRGYQFVAPVSQASKPSLLAPLSAEPVRLPRSAVGRIIGRVGFIERVVAALPHQRLITIVGPGGIGKTLVAIACAEALAGSYRGGVDFVDLAPVTEQASVAGALARVLGVAIGSIDPIRDLVRHLQDRQMLLVIDNCEHVVDAAAELVEAIVTGAPGVHVLATSREALRIAGELVRLLPPLPCAPDTPDLTAAEAITYPAVQLFVERATAAQQTFQILRCGCTGRGRNLPATGRCRAGDRTCRGAGRSIRPRMAGGTSGRAVVDSQPRPTVLLPRATRHSLRCSTGATIFCQCRNARRCSAWRFSPMRSLWTRQLPSPPAMGSRMSRSPTPSAGWFQSRWQLRTSAGRSRTIGCPKRPVPMSTPR